MSLRRKGLLCVKVNEKILVIRKDNKRTGARKTEDSDLNIMRRFFLIRSLKINMFNRLAEE